VIGMMAVVLLLGGCGPGEPETEVTIDSAPESGATVLLEGGMVVTTPATIRGLKPGTVGVLLTKENYRDTEDVIRVEPGGEPRSYVIEMEPLVGYVTVTSSPEGAEVYLDGEEMIGQTPLRKYPVPIGEHFYEVRYENYYPFMSDVIDVKPDYQYGLNTTVQLKPQEGTLMVTSKPSGANIWFNGLQQPHTTPHEYTLTPGTYIVDVHAPGHVMTGERVALSPNETVRLELAMKRGQVPAGMVLVPAGPFIRGSELAPDERPQAEIHVPAFYIDKYEVTNAEFKEVFPAHEFPEGWDNYPVVGVSWTQAVDYAQKVGKRLPREVEWEKAARGEQGLEFPWGNSYDPALCNAQDPTGGAPAERGTYIEGLSPYDCVDMAGNVYEWTQDWYQAYEGNTVVTKDYGQIFRVLRGGSFRSDRFDVRCAKRHYDRVSAARNDYGFRCAMDVKE
jgi:serine/threonine-protein kinase